MTAMRVCRNRSSVFYDYTQKVRSWTEDGISACRGVFQAPTISIDSADTLIAGSFPDNLFTIPHEIVSL